MIEKRIEFYKIDYLSRNGVSEVLYDFMLIAEYLRTKNVPNPQDLPIKKLFAFMYLHKELENRNNYNLFEIFFTVTGAYKIKKGGKMVKEMLRKLM